MDTVKGATSLLREIRDLLKDSPKQRPAAPASTPSSRPDLTPSGGLTGWRAFQIPFGKQQGRALGELHENSLRWWIENYKAEGYKGAPPRQSDLKFRAALDEAARELRGGAPQRDDPALERPAELPPGAARQMEEAEEDVPF